jgi:hypothetical protein
MHQARRCLLLACCLIVSGSGCVLRAAAYGGPQANRSPHRVPTHEGPPIYDCHKNLLVGSTCTPRPVAPPRRAPVLAVAGPQDTNVLRDGTLTTRSNVAGGTIVMRGRPAADATHVLLTLRSTQGLAPAPCDVRVYRDGSTWPVRESARPSDHQLQLAIAVESLHRLQDSTRFVIEGCGRSVALDAPARATLSQFEVRFREERSKLAR